MQAQYVVTIRDHSITVQRLVTAVTVPQDAAYVSTGANLNSACDALAQDIYAQMK